MNLIATPFEHRVKKPLERNQGKQPPEIGACEYDEKVVEMLRAAAETEPILPPQDTAEFFKFLHQAT